MLHHRRKSCDKRHFISLSSLDIGDALFTLTIMKMPLARHLREIKLSSVCSPGHACWPYGITLKYFSRSDEPITEWRNACYQYSASLNVKYSSLPLSKYLPLLMVFRHCRTVSSTWLVIEATVKWRDIGTLALKISAYHLLFAFDMLPAALFIPLQKYHGHFGTYWNVDLFDSRFPLW